MEALTGATTAALTIYDMCKSLSHDIVIREVKLIEKTGGNPTTEFQKMLNSTPKTSAKPPVHALLLAGGRSKRMGRDKADLLYEGGLNLNEPRVLAQRIPASLSIRDGQSLPKVQ